MNEYSAEEAQVIENEVHSAESEGAACQRQRLSSPHLPKQEKESHHEKY